MRGRPWAMLLCICPGVAAELHGLFCLRQQRNLAAEGKYAQAVRLLVQGEGQKIRVSVVAYTDSAEASVALAQARGDAVKNRLVALGVPADSIHVWARGDKSPLVANLPPGTTEPQNRRVEIVLVRK